MKYHIEYNNNIEIFLDRQHDISFAAYLYKNRVCVEKKMYTFDESIQFDYVDGSNSGGVYFIKVFIKGKSIIINDTSFFYIKNKYVNLVERILLFESENILIEGYFQDSDTLFCTFNGAKSTKKTKPFVTDFVIQNGWDCISVYQDNDTQYQFLSDELLYKVISPYLQGKEIYTYGASLGGYCAVYYAGILNANVIAGSPKNSAHPSICIDRFKKLSFLHHDIQDGKKSDKNIYILYDPTIRSDASFIQEQILSLYPNAKLLPLPKAGHMIFRRVLKLRRLKELILSIVNNSYFCEYNNIMKENHLYKEE